MTLAAALLVKSVQYVKEIGLAGVLLAAFDVVAGVDAASLLLAQPATKLPVISTASEIDAVFFILVFMKRLPPFRVPPAESELVLGFFTVAQKILICISPMLIEMVKIR
ncbi:hypothetical protein D3C73_469950 [compost metagenome]